MKFTLAGIFVAAAAMWRAERELLLALGGVFFALPMLAMTLMLAASGFPGAIQPEQAGAAMEAFYAANLIPLLCANAVLDFGTFAVLNLFLQGGGRTLGEVLVASLKRFVPFLLISYLASMAVGLGLSLLVFPGLFLFARSWLIGPAYAAAPEAGVMAAVRNGIRRSAGLNWVTILAASFLVVLAALFAILTATALVALLGSFVSERVVSVIGYILIAAGGGLAWTFLAVLRVAAYRAASRDTGASSGM
ncbi:hypothetical protein [Sphingomonas hengshuiensis]|uniref:Glycerophosphoryl diester phosphodiesterase membrane domain-containing protein n=1 Tax=Sphingomonas hengshuiensis TaxID=1609977 RepID=A0A7U5CUR2_9SPHN|nr:hypothetical protein [Sphingomonas hengshuiensis]AJP70906.1 hypothetical protein TS85_02340 [Sphingomonas hengshuiensis]